MPRGLHRRRDRIISIGRRSNSRKWKPQENSRQFSVISCQ
jgi:hypothetical protein